MPWKDQHGNSTGHSGLNSLIEKYEAATRKTHKTLDNGNTGINTGNTGNNNNPGNSNSTKMGNGASAATSRCIIQDKHSNMGITQLKITVDDLKAELAERDEQIKQYQCIVNEQETMIHSLGREIDKLKSVLQLTVHKDGNPNILSVIQEEAINGKVHRSKKQGVSGESSTQSGLNKSVTLEHHDKDFRSKQLIKGAILNNDFLRKLDSQQVREVIDCMYEDKIKEGCYVIREGDPGQHLYVCAEGTLEVCKDGQVLGQLSAGKAFGELAILYNCTRTASVKALEYVKLWALDRRVFQAIMMRTGMQRQQENIRFLQSVPLLSKLPSNKLSKIADVLEMEFYGEGEYVIREGTAGDTFFIIIKGKVKVSQSIYGCDTPKEIRTLQHGDYFGERALISEDRRTANVQALSPGVECLTVDRESFNQLIGDLNELKEKDYGDEARGARSSSEALPPICKQAEKKYANIRLQDLEIIATLGIGGFGRVELVQMYTDKTQSFALKCLKKTHIVQTRQQEHIYSEKKIMMNTNSPFLVRMYKTFKDTRYIYMMMEACLGGELWSILRDRGSFDDHTARFNVACVIEALEYLHGRGIIYRDLKPENLLLNSKGFCKLVDFGFAKKITNGQKTWTFCGTPEYVAPEIILNRGHDHAADYWSLGILMFELLTGSPPFVGPDPMKTYNIILKGIDIVEFPKTIGRNAHSLIKRLCREAPAERLGYQKNGITGIKKHRWFQGFDWEGLRKQTILPPILPKVKGVTDFSNFDTYPSEFDLPVEEFSGWDENF